MTNASKRALVSGGSRGIGAGIARYFAEQGMDVVVTYLNNEPSARELCSSLAEQHNVRCQAVACDVRSYDDAKRCVAMATEFLGGLDVLVNNAGITKDANLMTMLPEEWYEVINTNLNGVFHLTRAAITGFMRQSHGTIINVASVAGLLGLGGMSSYAAAKAGILGFTRSLARECAPRNVTVNALAPGFIDTDMSARLDERYKAEMIRSIPLKRFGTPREVASLAYYLTTPDARYVTGQVFVLDGGLSL